MLRTNRQATYLRAGSGQKMTGEGAAAVAKLWIDTCVAHGSSPGSTSTCKLWGMQQRGIEAQVVGVQAGSMERTLHPQAAGAR